ncbi:MAG: IclR family transcriptional regulator [Clostridiales bacterium]|nr:IclR family transcriptional regulator [Clostridiales bacterium]
MGTADTADKHSAVKSLARAMRVLECFTVEQPELGVSEIARMLDMQKSTVFNILSTFQDSGYVVKNPQTSKYYLGFKLLHLGYIVNQHLGLREIMLPSLTEIAETCREVCYFGTLNNDEVLYIEAVYPSTQQPTRNILGERAPLFCTGLGKAMLAYLPEERIAQVAAREKKAYTSHTLVDDMALINNLSEIRMNGYAVDNMEHEFGVRCVAVPLFGADGGIMGAVSVSGPSPRFDPQTIIQDANIIREIIRPLQKCL